MAMANEYQLKYTGEQIDEKLDLVDTLNKNKLNTSDLNDAINTALSQAKAGGEFNGKYGITQQVRINQESSEWETTIDGGKTWISTGVKAIGNLYIGSSEPTSSHIDIWIDTTSETNVVDVSIEGA